MDCLFLPTPRCPKSGPGLLGFCNLTLKNDATQSPQKPRDWRPFVLTIAIGSSTKNAAQIPFRDSLKRRLAHPHGGTLALLYALFMKLGLPTGTTIRVGGITCITFGTPRSYQRGLGDNL